MAETWLVLPLLLLLQSQFSHTQSVRFQSCVPFPDPSKMRYVTEQSDFLELDTPENPRSPLYQMAINPCLELEYYGVESKKSKVLTFYGTCDFREMFRYSIRIVSPYGCWQSELTLWDHRMEPGRCSRFQHGTKLTVDNWKSIIIVTAVGNQDRPGKNQTNNVLLTYESYYGKLTRSREKHFNHARIEECRCNRTGRRNLADLWRRHCQPRIDKPRSLSAFGWAVQLGLAMVVGVIVLYRTVVRILSMN